MSSASIIFLKIRLGGRVVRVSHLTPHLRGITYPLRTRVSTTYLLFKIHVLAVEVLNLLPHRFELVFALNPEAERALSVLDESTNKV
jgi:hypothetical protein